MVEIIVQPRASRSEVAGVHGGALRVRIAAPPVDGAANAEVVVFFAKLLGIGKSRIEIIAGHSNRRKRVLVRELTPEQVGERLGIGVTRSEA